MFIGFFRLTPWTESVVIGTIEKALKIGEKWFKAQLVEIKTCDSTDIYIPEKVS